MKTNFYITLLLILLPAAIALLMLIPKSDRNTTTTVDVIPETASDQKSADINPSDDNPSTANHPPSDDPPSRPHIHNPKIVVWKSARRLDLYSGDAIVRSYKIGLGSSPVGDKQSEGDGKTPEGEFYLCLKNPHSSFYMALGISYPSTDDAEAGLKEGRITQQQYESVRSAIEGKRQPPWDTPLGGNILIHGHGSSSDWTLGCIALDDADIRELYNSIPSKTPVQINP